MGEVAGFDELMRVRIAATVSQSVREVQRNVLEGWLELRGEAFGKFVGDVCGWKVEGETVKVPLNKENEAKGMVVRENVKFDRELSSFDLGIRCPLLTKIFRILKGRTQSLRADCIITLIS